MDTYGNVRLKNNLVKVVSIINYLLGIAAESERTLLTFLFARPTFEVILETVDIRSNLLSDPTEVFWFFLSSRIPVSGVEEKTSSCREDSSFSIHDKK